MRALPVRGNPALDPGTLGNRAVGRLLGSLRRSPDWTKPQSNVAGSGITRLEVHGLAYGTGEFQDSYGGETSDEATRPTSPRNGWPLSWCRTRSTPRCPSRLYCDLVCRIEKAIAAKIPDQWHDDAADHFRVIEVAGPHGGEVEHEQVLSGVGSTPGNGSIADALRAQRDPKSDRAQAVTCERCRAQLKAWAEAAKPKPKPKQVTAP